MIQYICDNLLISTSVDKCVNIHVDADPDWLLHDATFEKMGSHMAENDGRLLGLFDELSSFLTKIRLYNNRVLSDSHELAMF